MKYFNRNKKHLKLYKDESTMYKAQAAPIAVHQANIIYEHQCKHLEFLEKLIH